jgi:hypothetical protein
MKPTIAILALFVSTFAHAQALRCHSASGNGPLFLVAINSTSEKAAVFSASPHDQPEKWSLEHSDASVEWLDAETLSVRGVDRSETDWANEAQCFVLKKRSLELLLRRSPDDTYAGIAAVRSLLGVNPAVANCQLPSLKPEGPPFPIFCGRY